MIQQSHCRLLNHALAAAVNNVYAVLDLLARYQRLYNPVAVLFRLRPGIAYHGPPSERPNRTRTEGCARRTTWRRPRLHPSHREEIVAYFYVLPWILGFLLFTAGPMLYSIILIFLEWDILQPPRWAGLANFERLFQDNLFGVALWNTAYYTFLSVPLQVVVALSIALFLNLKLRGINLYRTIFYLPTIVPAVSSTMVWLWIFHPDDYGLMNMLLNLFGFPKQLWFQDPGQVKNVLVIISLWGTGNMMLIFLAGLQRVPDELLEAAAIDGATGWSRFWNVTLPMLSPTLFFNLAIGLIGSFQIFTTAFIATNGGPGNASLFYVLYLYRNGFHYYRMGYASLLAWILFIIIAAFTYVQFRVGEQWVYYD